MSASQIQDLIVGVVVCTFALVVLFVLIPHGVDQPGNVDVYALGPRFWPTIIGVFILLMGLATVVQVLRRATGSAVDAAMSEAAASGFVAWRCATAIGLLFAYYVAMSIEEQGLGMVVASILAMAAFCALASSRHLAVALPLPVILPVLLFLFFSQVAGVSIPLGRFESWVY